MSDVEWPEPADDPDEERGEDPHTHLLPSFARLRSMSRRERRLILELIRDWNGPLVEAWRERERKL